jgi:hypothetical protein
MLPGAGYRPVDHISNEELPNEYIEDYTPFWMGGVSAF